MFRNTYIIILIFSGFSAFAQETPVEIEPQNNNTNVLNNNSMNYNGAIETEQQDTVILQKEQVKPAVKLKSGETRAARKLKKAPTRSLEATPKAESEPNEESELQEEISTQDDYLMDSENAAGVQSAGYQQANYGFTMSQSQATHQPMQRSPLPEHQMEMDKAVNYFETNAPNSFEYHYFKYTAGNYDVSQVEHLREAEKLMPANSDVHAQMAAYNIITRDADSAGVYVDKLVNSGRLNSNTLLYAEDLLISVPENGVLITHGFDDTYSAFQKQQEDGVRDDVTLISLDFLQSEQYRAQLEEDGFELPEQEVINVDYLAKFCELNASKPISISMTTPKEYFLPIKQNLYVTGLVFEYHQDTYNNFDRNNELWNSNLSKHLIDEAVDEKSKQLSANYLPMLLQLRKVYGQQGEIKKLKEIDDAIDKVSLQCRKYDQVQKLKSSY
ncbi:MAG: hypothetical protein Crog4KO_03970 [Crocinitomicaceae bacterium]